MQYYFIYSKRIQYYDIISKDELKFWYGLTERHFAELDDGKIITGFVEIPRYKKTLRFEYRLEELPEEILSQVIKIPRRENVYFQAQDNLGRTVFFKVKRKKGKKTPYVIIDFNHPYTMRNQNNVVNVIILKIAGLTDKNIDWLNELININKKTKPKNMADQQILAKAIYITLLVEGRSELEIIHQIRSIISNKIAILNKTKKMILERKTLKEIIFSDGMPINIQLPEKDMEE